MACEIALALNLLIKLFSQQEAMISSAIHRLDHLRSDSESIRSVPLATTRRYIHEKHINIILIYD